MNTVIQEIAGLLRSVGASFVHVLPLLAVAVPLSVYLKHAGISAKMEKLLRGRQVLAVFIATLIGAVSPLCSCGVIPVIAALLVSGVPLAPVMAFWLASPSMDPEIFVLSVGMIGWKLAIWRLLATFVMSFGAGLVTIWIEKKGFLGQDILRGRKTDASTCNGGACGSPRQKEPLANSYSPVRLPTAPVLKLSAETAGIVQCNSQIDALERKESGCADSTCAAAKVGSLAQESLMLLLRLSLYMGIAFVLEALIKRYVPSDFIVGLLGRDSAFAVPLATAIGIPLYTTELAAMGLVSGLLAQGMSPAAALSFLVGGGVTTIPAMSAVFGVVRPKIFALYLAFCVTGALLAGYAMEAATKISTLIAL